MFFQVSHVIHLCLCQPHPVPRCACGICSVHLCRVSIKFHSGRPASVFILEAWRPSSKVRPENLGLKRRKLAARFGHATGGQVKVVGSAAHNVTTCHNLLMLLSLLRIWVAIEKQCFQGGISEHLFLCF